MYFTVYVHIFALDNKNIETITEFIFSELHAYLPQYKLS